MRLFTGAAISILTLAACQPDSVKTNPPLATQEAAAERAAAAPAAGANSFTMEQARERITGAGFTDVGALSQEASGAWKATAMKDGASKSVTVDYQGNVTAQ
jgi:hypothetical protein